MRKARYSKEKQSTIGTDEKCQLELAVAVTFRAAE